MSQNIKNPYVDFYDKYKISPVNQDISDFRLHMMRREKLYRMLGMPPILFAERTVLEVGPGGGYNSLALFAWGANVDFVEPNPTAQQQIPELLNSYGIDRERWNLYTNTIEEISTDKKYDVVIAEGFIPGLYERETVIRCLSELVKQGGVVVVTCVDDISYLMELIKRIVAHHLIHSLKPQTFYEKVKVLSIAFSSHLKSLQYATRPIEDWVTDLFLNPAAYGNFFSIADCIQEFGNFFALLGSSPSMFTDYSWYKDVSFNSKEAYLEQFEKKRHILLMTGIEEKTRLAKDNLYLQQSACRLRNIAEKYENTQDGEHLKEIITSLKEIGKLSKDIDLRIFETVKEAIGLLLDNELNSKKIEASQKLATSFGKGQQYVSLVKVLTF